MHYHKSKFLRFANAFRVSAADLTFIFAGWLRSYTHGQPVLYVGHLDVSCPFRPCMRW